MTTEIDVRDCAGSVLYVPVDGVRYIGRNVYYRRPAITKLTPVEEFDDKSTYFFIWPHEETPRPLGKYKGILRITGGRAYDYDYQVFQFELGNVVPEKRSQVFYTDIVPEYDESGIVPIAGMTYNDYPLVYFDATDNL